MMKWLRLLTFLPVFLIKILPPYYISIYGSILFIIWYLAKIIKKQYSTDFLIYSIALIISPLLLPFEVIFFVWLDFCISQFFSNKRIILAFIVLVLIPFIFLNFYYKTTEDIYKLSVFIFLSGFILTLNKLIKIADINENLILFGCTSLVLFSIFRYNLLIKIELDVTNLLNGSIVSFVTVIVAFLFDMLTIKQSFVYFIIGIIFYSLTGPKGFLIALVYFFILNVIKRYHYEQSCKSTSYEIGKFPIASSHFPVIIGTSIFYHLSPANLKTEFFIAFITAISYSILQYTINTFNDRPVIFLLVASGLGPIILVSTAFIIKAIELQYSCFVFLVIFIVAVARKFKIKKSGYWFDFFSAYSAVLICMLFFRLLKLFPALK